MSKGEKNNELSWSSLLVPQTKLVEASSFFSSVIALDAVSTFNQFYYNFLIATLKFVFELLIDLFQSDEMLLVI